MLVRVPWAPELFSAPALQQVLDKYRRKRLRSVPFFDGLLAGETDALVASFAGVPAVHHPLRGWIRGEEAFREFVGETMVWIAERHVEVEAVNILITTPRGVEEVVLRLDGDRGRIGLPLAFAVDHDDNERIVEMRLYFSTWPLTGRRTSCPPLPRPDRELDGPDVVGQYRRALATGDVDAILAAFEPDGYLREPDGDTRVHRGPAELRARYERFFAEGGGGIALEPCSVTDDGRICALEYNAVARGPTALSPAAAGLAVYVRGDSGKLAAARVYNEPDPPPDQGAPP
jgi:SnoaL-like domain